MDKSDHTNCCVYGCKSRRKNDNNIHFHKFPAPKAETVKLINHFGIVENIDRRKAWSIKLKMGKPVGTAMRVCSNHFTTDDFIFRGVNRVNPKLKRTAIPSVNLPVSSIPLPRPENATRMDRYLKIQEKRKNKVTKTQQKSKVPETTTSNTNLELDGSTLVSECYHNNESEVVKDGVTTMDDLSEIEKDCVSGLMNLFESAITGKENNSSVLNCDKGVQVTSGDIIISFSSTIHTEKQLNSLTGIETFELLNTLIDLVKKYYADKKKHSLTVKDRIILVFMKLKLSLTFVVISFLFKISPATCRLIFNDYIDKLANILKSCIIWPSIEEIRRNIPACFKNFQSVRIILDCTEIAVQRPKCLCCRIRTYSNYKGKHTVKIMTGVTPAGLITFLSKAYGGRASDKAIFEQSKLIEKLESHFDSIMVDKGFLIDKICEENFIKIIRPAFLRKKTQFSEYEAKQNVSISKARVHVERLNQRIKTFQIFNHVLPWNMVKNIEDIFTVVVGMVNLQKPILSDDKF